MMRFILPGLLVAALLAVARPARTGEAAGDDAPRDRGWRYVTLEGVAVRPVLAQSILEGGPLRQDARADDEAAAETSDEPDYREVSRLEALARAVEAGRAASVFGAAVLLREHALLAMEEERGVLDTYRSAPGRALPMADSGKARVRIGLELPPDERTPSRETVRLRLLVRRLHDAPLPTREGAPLSAAGLSEADCRREVRVRPNRPRFLAGPAWENGRELVLILTVRVVKTPPVPPGGRLLRLLAVPADAMPEWKARAAGYPALGPAAVRAVLAAADPVATWRLPAAGDGTGGAFRTRGFLRGYAIKRDAPPHSVPTPQPPPDAQPRPAPTPVPVIWWRRLDTTISFGEQALGDIPEFGQWIAGASAAVGTARRAGPPAELDEAGMRFDAKREVFHSVRRIDTPAGPVELPRFVGLTLTAEAPRLKEGGVVLAEHGRGLVPGVTAALPLHRERAAVEAAANGGAARAPAADVAEAAGGRLIWLLTPASVDPPANPGAPDGDVR